MNTDRICTKCGKVIPASSHGGLCPPCLFGEVMPPPLRAGSVLGDYQLLEEIGRGGMGVVFKARQISLNRIVAVKVMLQAGSLASEEQRQRFQIEAEAAARLNHPHIVPIYQVGEYDGWHFLVMELIEGKTLDEGPKNYPTKLDSIALLVEKVARAVHHAHLRGVRHLDLKPGNILLDAAGEPHVTDFGLARFGQDDASSAGHDRKKEPSSIIGTPSCMSPEQARGNSDEITTASDVYSLGAVLYHLLTGKPPFEGESASEVLEKVKTQKPVLPSIVRGQRTDGRPQSSSSPPLLPGWDFGPRPSDLEVICLKCLEKTPASRYSTAEALAQDLKRYYCGEPIVARPPRMVERVSRWSRRHPAAVLGSLLLIGALWFATTRAQQGEEKLREQLHSFAQHAANTVSSRLKDFSVPVTDAANQLRPDLEPSSYDQDRLQKTLLDVYTNNLTSPLNQGAGEPFETWYLLNSNGVIVARALDGPTRGQNFGMRDYFLGTMAKRPDSRVSPVHVSRIYLSKDDELYKFGICVPLFSTNREGPPLGVLVAAVTTQSTLGPLRLTNAQHQVVLAGRWDSNRHPQDNTNKTAHIAKDSFLILDHSQLTNRSEAVPVSPGELHNQLKRHVVSKSPELQLTSTAAGIPFEQAVDEKYQDPLQPQTGERLAAFAQVANTELAVIVQHNDTRSFLSRIQPLIALPVVLALALMLLLVDVARNLRRDVGPVEDEGSRGSIWNRFWGWCQQKPTESALTAISMILLLMLALAAVFSVVI